jgi:hypothetical protein
MDLGDKQTHTWYTANGGLIIAFVYADEAERLDALLAFWDSEQDNTNATEILKEGTDRGTGE